MTANPCNLCTFTFDTCPGECRAFVRYTDGKRWTTKDLASFSLAQSSDRQRRRDKAGRFVRRHRPFVQAFRRKRGQVTYA